MTEVPEHLLRRSKERRAALGGGGDGGSEPPATPGDYPYVCTFPGHGVMMRGVMHVKP